MKNVKFITFMILFVTTANCAFTQSSLPQWNGYIQTRLSSNFDNSSEFTIRRAKLWVYGTVPKVDFITYKIQMVYRSFKDDALMFQDAYADIKMKSFGTLRAGRFVPDFMLQRMQPDYEIPVLERALVINSLIHNEKQMARETGVQYTYQSDSLPLHFSMGVFNANVDKPMQSKDNSLLYTTRLNYKIINNPNEWLTFGGSASYRHLDKLSLTTIYNPNLLITGNDYRWGLEAQLHWNGFELQGEYVQANINKDIAKGYYSLANYTFYSKYQIVILTEKYNDLNPVTNDNAWYGAGFNYFIKGKTKLMTDFKAQGYGNKLNCLGEIQLQIFIN